MKFNRRSLRTTTAVAFFATICTISFLGSVPKTKAMGYNRISHCTPWKCNAGGWNLALHRHDFFDNLHDLFFFPTNHMVRRESSRFFPQSSLQYEIREDDSKLELIIDVPGVSASDINIHLEKDERLLTVSGSRSARYEGKDRKNTFEKTFTVNPKVIDTDKLKADMADGVLVISAPKFQEQEVKEKRLVEVINTKGNVSSRHEESVLITQVEKKEEAIAAKEESSEDDLEITEEDI